MLKRRAVVSIVNAAAAVVLGALLAVTGSCTSHADSLSVAVAANFTEPAKEIAVLFERETGHKVVLSFGSTGQLLTQITQAAPFDVFLSADQSSANKAIAGGFGARDGRITYAVGKIALYSRGLDLGAAEAVLRNGGFEKLAIANPKLAPYGVAALEILQALGLTEQLRGKLVQGNNIAQTFQFVESGTAELGFVALSQVVAKDGKFVWVVPDSLYSPLLQDAILLKDGERKPAARAFLALLKSRGAEGVIQKYGYQTVH